MKALLIKDLSLAADLDDAAMSAVHGGTYGGFRMPEGCFPSLPKFEYGKAGDIDFNASQSLGQAQNTTVNNGNCSAFVCGIKADVNPHQTGTNNINFG